MLPARHAVARAHPPSTHICLSCRLKTRQQRQQQQRRTRCTSENAPTEHTRPYIKTRLRAPKASNQSLPERPSHINSARQNGGKKKLVRRTNKIESGPEPRAKQPDFHRTSVVRLQNLSVWRETAGPGATQTVSERVVPIEEQEQEASKDGLHTFYGSDGTMRVGRDAEGPPIRRHVTSVEHTKLKGWYFFSPAAWDRRNIDRNRQSTGHVFEDVSRPYPQVRRQWGTPGSVKVRELKEAEQVRKGSELEGLFDEHAGATVEEEAVMRNEEQEAEVKNEKSMTTFTPMKSAANVAATSPAGVEEFLREPLQSEKVERWEVDESDPVNDYEKESRAMYAVEAQDAVAKLEKPAQQAADEADDIELLETLDATLSRATSEHSDRAQQHERRPQAPAYSRDAGRLAGSSSMAWQHASSAKPSSQARAYYTSSRRSQQQAMSEAQASSLPPHFLNMPSTRKPESPNGIRAQLRRWQAENGHLDSLHNDAVDPGADLETGSDTVSNNLTRLPDPNAALRTTQAEEEEDEREAMAHFMQAPSDEPSSSDLNTRFLKMGDLVEIEYIRSERESLVGIFVRRTGALAQFYTMQGRWVHVNEKKVQYAIPSWVAEEQVQPLLDFLPSPEDVEERFEEMMEEAYIKDLSVPRHVAAPLVSRMVQFHAEAKEIYRRHASTLDNAHNLLAHETDLRYGSLVSAATTLLRTPAEKLPVTALFAVRQALTHAGFAFNIDRRSHRLTGYLQIRSKEQVKMVEHVRNWLREWQDDLALQASMTEAQRRRHRPKRGAQFVQGFLEKAKKIISRSREDREPTQWGNVGPSKVKLPITPEQDCVRITKEEMFSEEDTELVRFIEAWSLSQMFTGLPRIESLPPLLLQATGLYEDHALAAQTGLLFLQELGTILPYENRVRFDQHLLLPSSQHSKPLQNLMTSLIAMSSSHNFVDSMAGLRHDWKQLPVYCIDAASAHEIDDGLSIEPAAIGTDGVKEWWIHVHIANPTAFFSRDHPLAKMARHMGESIYMPERTYMMLPRWSTQRHFSLGRDRPCLTFSARVDGKGETLERKIRSGTIRNVLRLTPDEVAGLLDVKDEADGLKETVLTVGGEPPPDKKRRSQIGEVDPSMVKELKTLRMLAEKRQDLRKAAGGLFFDTHKPDVNVWQSYNASGLAWDHPFRKGWRRVEGDPVIQMKTKGLINWFSPFDGAIDVLVRETMLLACEIAATWCADRQIPAVFRGSVRRPDKMASEKFFEEILAPAASKSERGEYPMHLGMKYLETFGNTALSTRPFKHRILGMDNYGKVTSPLRRYGDMILHWQIEAALREEAATGQSLVTSDLNADRSFLPFSSPVLSTILVGLQPRESIIMKAKMYAENFWITQLLFRAHHFREIPLPFETVRAYVHSAGASQYADSVGCMIQELNITASMQRPENLLGKGGGVDNVARMGDVWECAIEGVDCFRRIAVLRPLRLVERVE